MNELIVLQDTQQRELEHAESAIERAVENAFMEWGLNLKHIKDNKLYGSLYRTWEEYCQERWEMSRQRAEQLIDAYDTTQQIATFVDKTATIVALPSRESQIRPLKMRLWNGDLTLSTSKTISCMGRFIRHGKNIAKSDGK